MLENTQSTRNKAADTALETMSISEFAKAKGFVEFNPTIAVNTNGYPFVTFITGDNVAENIYLTKKAAEDYPEGYEIGEVFFKDMLIILTENEKGESRIKLGKKGGKRKSLADFF